MILLQHFFLMNKFEVAANSGDFAVTFLNDAIAKLQQIQVAVRMQNFTARVLNVSFFIKKKKNETLQDPTLPLRRKPKSPVLISTNPAHQVQPPPSQLTVSSSPTHQASSPSTDPAN